MELATEGQKSNMIYVQLNACSLSSVFSPVSLCSLLPGRVCGVFAGPSASDERQTLPEAAAGVQQQRQPEGERPPHPSSLPPPLPVCQHCHYIYSLPLDFGQVSDSKLTYLRSIYMKLHSGRDVKVLKRYGMTLTGEYLF